MREFNITDDLLVEILVKLPLKSLYRFKCVSKSWYRLISDDNHLQRRLPPVTTGMFFRSDSDQFKKARYAYTCSSGTIKHCDLDFFPFGGKSVAVDSSNGLVLYYLPASMMFYVVNTGTKSWVSLPKPRKASLLSVLAFDPCSSVEYRVVCFTEWRAKGAELEIYSSETGKWNRHGVNFGVVPDAMSTTMHYFDGTLYILSYPNTICAFDLTKFSCNSIHLPKPIDTLSRIGHCQGSLHYAGIEENKLKIWMMSCLNGSKWELKHEIALRDLKIHKLNQVNLVAFHPEKEVVCVWFHNWKLVWYDFKEKKLVASWKFEKEKEKVSVIQVWLFPCSGAF